MVKDGKLGIEDLLSSAAAISEGLSTMVIGMYDRQIEKSKSNRKRMKRLEKKRRSALRT